ncbi:MAG TPA: hypothetical protein VKO45_05835, partial [Methanomicrobiales archaeon]|nr:hypothetical protein [Methanomicrobiales archaeon]
MQRTSPASGGRVVLLLFLLVLLTGIPAAAAGFSGGTVVGYYFTGEGCPHCARVNPELFGKWLTAYPGLVVVEYEVYGHPENAAVMAGWDPSYGLGLSIPVMTFGRNATFIGDVPILQGVPGLLNQTLGEAGSAGGTTSLGALDIAGLQGYPRVWMGDRVLVRENLTGGDTGLLRALLSGGDPAVLLSSGTYRDLGPLSISHGDLSAGFLHSARTDGWLIGWNTVTGTNATATPTVTPSTTPTPGTCPQAPELTAGKIIALAAVNAINPCALAVLVVILLAIITQNPGRREKVLLAGLA